MSSKVFRPNLQSGGRKIRAAMAVIFAGCGVLALPNHGRLGILFFASAAFLLFEALRGWCALRACGVRTKF